MLSKLLSFLAGAACAFSVSRWLNDAGRAEHQQGQNLTQTYRQEFRDPW